MLLVCNTLNQSYMRHSKNWWQQSMEKNISNQNRSPTFIPGAMEAGITSVQYLLRHMWKCVFLMCGDGGQQIHAILSSSNTKITNPTPPTPYRSQSTTLHRRSRSTTRRNPPPQHSSSRPPPLRFPNHQSHCWHQHWLPPPPNKWLVQYEGIMLN